jgi:glycosyltransferase involved in cell wall biosynthesis
MRRLLVISYRCPPQATAGVHRTLRIIRHLPNFGWTPIVLTVKRAVEGVYDPILLAEVSSQAVIYRANSIEPTRWIDFRSRKGQEAVDIQIDKRPLRGFMYAVTLAFRAGYRLTIKRWLPVSRSRVGWLPFAINLGYSLIKRMRVDAIYATGPPFVAHVVGCLLKKCTGIPLVLDYRDAWTLDPNGPNSSRLRHFVNEWLEQFVMDTADRIVVCTEQMAKAYVGKYQKRVVAKLITIPNGFDREEFRGLRYSKPKDNKFNIVYAGSFFGRRRPDTFLTALRELVDELPYLKNDLRFVYAGKAPNEMLVLIDRLNLRPIVHLLPFLSHRSALELMVNAQLLLLVVSDTEGSDMIATSKLYEYIATGVPILALSPPGAASQVLKRTRTGLVISPQDVAGTKDCLLTIYRNRRGSIPGIAPDSEAIAEYDFQRLTAKWAQLFGDLVYNRSN